MSDATRPTQPESVATAPRHVVEDAPTIITRSVLSPPGGANPALFADLKGKRLAHFELEEQIGIGGMAAVIRARDLQLDRVVALKVLPPDLAGDGENVRRFENEARAGARLDHENVARVYYYGFDHGLHFIAFEFVDGINLRAMLEERGRLPVPEAVNYVLQIAQGLAHAASRGVIHRDIKPSNVIVTPAGRAKLVDMGLARNVGLQPDPGLTQSGMTLGTFDYISPEQALEPRTADVRSDIYSLGCTFYHLLTGRAPAPEGTPARKLQFHQNEAPLDPRLINPEVSDQVAAVLARMIAKDPAERYQSPDVLVQQLAAVFGDFPLSQGSINGNVGDERRLLMLAPPSGNATRYAMRPALTFALGVLGILVLVGIVVPLTEKPLRRQVSAEQRDAINDSKNDRKKERDRPNTDSESGTSAGNNARRTQPLAVTVRNVAELRSALKDSRSGDVIRLEEGTYDLLAESDGLIEITSGPVVVEAKDNARPVLRGLASVTSAAESSEPPSLLSVRDGHLTLRRLVFDLVANQSGSELAGIVVDGGYLGLENCEFTQQRTKSGKSFQGLTSLRVGGHNANSVPASVIEARGCVFWGGGQGVVLEDASRLILQDCAIGPYEQPFRCRENARGKIGMSLTDCSMLLGTGPAFRIEGLIEAECSLTRCVVSQLEAERDAVLFAVQRDALDVFHARSDRNYFHNLDVFLSRLGEDGGLLPLVREPGDLIRFPNVQDARSVFESQSPWQESNPLAAFKARDASRAFRLNPLLASLRPQSDQILGAKQLLNQTLYASLPTLTDPKVTAVGEDNHGEYVVDGEGMRPHSFKNLGSALNAAEKEDDVTILVKVNGPLQTRRLDVRRKRISIRAASGFAPELVFSPEQVLGADGEAAFFVIQDGEVNFEQMAFRLSPLRDQENVKLQSAVSVTGTGRARFKGCLVTLGDPPGTPMALVAVADPSGAMMGNAGKAPKPGSPTIELEDCFLRGHGDLLNVRTSRPFRLDVRNCLAVLDGSLVLVDGNRPEAAGSGEAAQASFDHVTAYLKQSVLTLRASASNPTHVPMRVASATTCIFAAADGQPLVRIDGPLSEIDLRRRVAWQGKRNSYVSTGPLLVWQPLDRMDMPHRYDGDGWGELWGPEDDQPRFLRTVRFTGFPSEQRSFLDVVASDLAVQATDPPEADATVRGAELDRLPHGGVPGTVEEGQ